ncbi:MAG: CsbD family protein [Limnospira sp.]
MSTEEKTEATLKNLEGKAQEMVGEVTGDPKQKAEGQAKQTEATFQHAVENVKEEAKKEIEEQ